MLVARFGVVVLSTALSNAQLYTNSSTSLGSSDATSASASTNTTTTSSPAISTTFPNQQHYDNGTTNACQASFDAWSSDQFWNPVEGSPVMTTVALTDDYERTTFSTEIYDCTQTCGTICYAGPVTTIISTTHIYKVSTQTFGDNPPYTTPRPNCTIGFDDCLSIQTSWSSAMTSYENLPLESVWSVMEPPPPACSACVTTDCTFVGMFGVSVYYWPVATSVSRDYCASDPVGGPATYVPDVNHTYVPTTTGPYAVVNDITMYEGNVYLSFYEPRVLNNCGHEVARRSPGHNIVTVGSDAMHSIRSYPHIFASFPVKWDIVPYQVNFDDFNPPTPYSAYAGMMDCAQPGLDHSGCSIVKPDGYFPYMLMPPQIRDLDENWKNCHYDSYAAFDPPIALHTRSGMFSSVNARPTSTQNAEPVHISQSQPAPGQSGADGIPAATPRPENPGPDVNPTPPASPGFPNALRPPSVGPQKPTDDRPTSTNAAEINKPNDQPRPVITIGPSVVPIDISGGLVLGPGTTLRNGDPPVVLDGTEVSLGSSGVVLKDNNGIHTILAPYPVPSGAHVITIGPYVIPIDLSGSLVIRPGFTLEAGDSPVTIDGTVVSIGSSAVILIASRGTMTVPIPSSAPATSQLITIGTNTYTATNGQLVMGTKLTLSVSGGAVILAGTTIWVASDGIMVVSSSKTSIIPIESKGANANNADKESTQNTGNAKKTGSIQASLGTNTSSFLDIYLLVLGTAFMYMLFIGV